MARLKIGIDAHVVTGRYQGTRTTLTNLLRALAKQKTDHEIIVYTDDPDEARATIGADNFAYRPLGHSGSIKRLFRDYPRLLRRDGIDVAVFQYIAPLSGRNVVFVHDILPMSFPRYFPLLNRLRVWFFYSLSIRRAAMVLAVSEDTRRSIEGYYKLPPGKVRTVLNGPSFPLATYEGTPAAVEPRYILTVGRIEERKNVPLLVDAFLKADVPGLRLIVVGAFDLGFDYRFPDDPRVENRVGLGEAELIQLYRGASLFVYPSAAEGFGIPLLDALLFGLPVISSDRTAMAEIASGVAAVFDPTAPGAADLLAGLIAGHFGGAPVPPPSSAQRQELARRFDWDRAAAGLLAAIEAVAAT